MARYTSPVDHTFTTQPAPAQPDAPAPGRRERKKEQTRLALIDTALDLFARQGYDATPIEQITDALDLSRRTFNRYFTAKEDVVLAVARDVQAELLLHLRAQPAALSPAEALRAMFLTFLDGLRAADRARDLARYLLHSAVISENPVLAAHGEQLAHAKDVETAALMAARLGLSEPTDPRARYLVAAWGAAVRVAMEDLLARCPEPDLDAWSQAVQAAFELYTGNHSATQ